MNETTELLGFRTKLASLWASLVLIYLYADVLSLYRPGNLSSMLDGMMGPMEANQSSLLFATLLMLVPCLMVAGAFVFSIPKTRILNRLVGVVFVFVSVGNLIGETWLYYLLFGVFEIGLTLYIVILTLSSKANRN